MTNQPKIIGRFEPIGLNVGRPRAAFDVVSKHEVECLGLRGKPGYCGVKAKGGDYSVISEHWRFVPVECEHDFKGHAPDGGPISMLQPVVYVCRKCGEQEDV